MKFGNIIFENELINHKKVEYINYYNEKLGYNQIDNSLPTLYVGWSFMKKCNPDNEFILNSDILDKKIVSKELYWEFDFNEKKSEHIKGVEEFVNNVFDYYLTSKYTYINLDPVFFQLKDIDDLIDVLPTNIDKIYKYKDEMIYILYNNKITGINLNIYSFFNFDIKKIITILAEKSKTIIDDLNGELFVEQNKIYLSYPTLKRYMVVIL